MHNTSAAEVKIKEEPMSGELKRLQTHGSPSKTFNSPLKIIESNDLGTIMSPEGRRSTRKVKKPDLLLY